MDYSRQTRLVLYSGFVQGAFYVRNMALLAIFTHCLGTQLFGVWSKMHALVGIAMPLVGFGVLDGAARFLPSASAERRGVLFWSAAAGIAAGGVPVMFLFWQLAPSLGRVIAVTAADATVPAMYLVLGLAVLGGMLVQHCTNSFRLTDRPRAYGLAIGAQVVSLVMFASGGWALLGATLWVPVLTLSMAPFTVVFACLRSIGRTMAVRVQFSAIRDMIAYGAPLVPMTALTWVTHFADRYMIALLQPGDSDAMVGVYAANYALGGLIVAVFSCFFPFYSPALTRLWDAGDRAQAAHLTRQTVKYALVLAVPMLVASPLLARVGVRIVAGREFQAVPAVMFTIMLGYLFQMLASFAVMVLSMQKRTTRILVHALIASLVNVALNLLLIPLGGPVGGILGAGIATAAGFGTYLLLGVGATLRVPGAALGLANMIRVGGAGAVAAAIIWWVDPHTLWPLVAATFAAVVAYVALLLATRTLRMEELGVLRRSVRELLRAGRAVAGGR